MKINYPNASDRILKTHQRAGGEIFIHGQCASIGCVSIENYIKPLYWLCIQADSPIVVHSFPARFDSNKFIGASENSTAEQKKFWSQLQVFYSEFNKNHKIPKFSIDKFGNYLLRK